MKLFIRSMLVFIFFAGSSLSAMAAVHRVPDDYSTIQAAIDASAYGDTVLVSAGRYYENITLKSGVKVRGAGRDITYLNGMHSGSVVTAVDVTSAEFSGFWVYSYLTR